MTKPKFKNKYEQQLLKYALRFPEAYEDNPWDERVVKVRKKIFVFLHGRDGELAITTKLPFSGVPALSLPFTSPTGYGLGKAGWVTSAFAIDGEPPLDLLEEWIEESYRAVAPKKLVHLLPSLG